MSKALIFLAAGGTGGHVFPALALKQQLTGIFDAQIITEQRGSKFLAARDIFYKLYIPKPSSGIIAKLWLLINLGLSTLQVIRLYLKYKPKLVIAFGGYPTVPMLLAAKCCRVPIVLHEQNSILGKTNRYFAAAARVIALTFPLTASIPAQYQHKVLVSGTFIRESITRVNNTVLPSNRFSLLVFGGSQGAGLFSKIMPETLALLKANNPHISFSIVQQAKTAEDLAALIEYYNALGIEQEVRLFFDNILDKYLMADLVICRAGSTTIAELVALQQPAIMIPLPSAVADHQLHNAKAVAAQQAGWYIEERELTPPLLSARINTLVNSRSILLEASTRLQSLNFTNASKFVSMIKTIINSDTGADTC